METSANVDFEFRHAKPGDKTERKPWLRENSNTRQLRSVCFLGSSSKIYATSPGKQGLQKGKRIKAKLTTWGN
jgi:hypothetical protein